MNTTTKLNNIQVLRAFAAFAVVQFHSGFVFPHMHPVGSFGVDVFLVISGFIMARILFPTNPAPDIPASATPASASPLSAELFFRRRVLRIVPPYWLLTLLLFFASMRLPKLMTYTRPSTSELLKSLFFIPFIKRSGVLQPLLFIGWSLNNEMFFYLALTLGILIHQHLLNAKLRAMVHAVWLGAALMLITMFTCAPFAAGHPAARFYSGSINYEFVLGILSYYLCRAIATSLAPASRSWSQLSINSVRILVLLLALGSATSLIVMQGTEPHIHAGSPSLAIPCFLLVTSTGLLSLLRWDLAPAQPTPIRSIAGWLILTGDASYILYLIHPYCEYSIDRILGPHLHWLQRQTPTGAILGIAISVAVAILVHLYAELPTVRYLNRNFGGHRSSTEFAPPITLRS